MNRKMLFPLFVILLVMLTPMGVAQADGPVKVTKEIKDSPSFANKDWPIIHIETWEYKDPLSGQVRIHKTVTRENPVKRLVTAEGLPCGSEDLSITSECVLQGEVSMDDADTNNGVTVRLVHFADKYCKNDNCYFTPNVYFKMKRVELWWERSSLDQSAGHATLNWGVTGPSTTCDGDYFGYWYSDGPFDPAWNGLYSYTYIYTSDDWPILQGSTDVNLAPGANSHSVGGGNDLYVSTWWYALGRR
jgi:hypothetical protein